VKGKAGERTLLASLMLSAPGPIVLGAALLAGRSATQLADFIRRTAELGAIVVSWAVYRTIAGWKQPNPARQEKLERAANTSVGMAMLLSGAVMCLLALSGGDGAQGSVLPALVIALPGAATNFWFWLRYSRLSRGERDSILTSQSQLYGAKTLVDLCVTAALAVILIAPHSAAAAYVDLMGSLIVAAHLAAGGVRVLRRAGWVRAA